MPRIRVHLRDTETGISGILTQGWGLEPDRVAYQYGTGNYGCDCNRSCFLAKANPAFDEAVNEEVGCNVGPNRIAIDRIEDEHGDILYEDAWRD